MKNETRLTLLRIATELNRLEREARQAGAETLAILIAEAKAEAEHPEEWRDFEHG